jgi:hypothetical protein
VPRSRAEEHQPADLTRILDLVTLVSRVQWNVLHNLLSGERVGWPIHCNVSSPLCLHITPTSSPYWKGQDPLPKHTITSKVINHSVSEKGHTGGSLLLICLRMLYQQLEVLDNSAKYTRILTDHLFKDAVSAAGDTR